MAIVCSLVLRFLLVTDIYKYHMTLRGTIVQKVVPSETNSY